jgi:hypothetical protein
MPDLATISVDFQVPFSDDEWPGLCVSFHRWLPFGEEKGVTRTMGQYRATLWFENDDIYVLDRSLVEDLSRWNDLPVGRARVRVLVGGVSQDLALFIYGRGKLNGEADPTTGFSAGAIERLNDDFRTLGKDVLKLVLETFNRFVDFARVEKFQYWLLNRVFDEDRINSDNIRFHAHVTIPTFGSVPWRPKFTDNIFIELPFSYDHAIAESEWPLVQAYVSADRRASAVKELISTSLTLLDAGYTRSAIIESVAALELAVNQFSNRPNIAELTSPESGRIELHRLSATRGHLGFSSFFRYVLPLISPPARLSTDLITNSSELIELRQTAVHSGRRSFPEVQEVRKLILDAAKVCLILVDTTARVSSVPDDS